MLPRKFWHESVNEETIIEACERRMSSLDDPGYCLICGCEHYGIEPDARHVRCEACGAPQVYGCEELLQVIA